MDNKMKHWTTEICDANMHLGFKYTIFDRRGHGDNKHRACNTIREVYAWIEDRYGKIPDGDKPRWAFIPDSMVAQRSWSLMYYPEDGTFWVRGRLVVNSEPQEGDYTPLRTPTDAGVI